MADQQVVVELKAKTENLEKGFKRADKATKKFSQGLKKVAVVAAGVGVAILGVVKITKELIDAFAKQEIADRKLASNLKLVTASVEEAAEAFNTLKAQSKELQKITPFGDEAIENAQAMLATFQLAPKQIEELTPRLLDMAAASADGSGEMADLQQVAIQLGKAAGPTGLVGGLSRFGVVVSDMTKELYAAGNTTEGLSSLLKDLDGNFKGIAETVGSTVAGRLAQFKNMVGDLKETLGGQLAPVVMQLLPPLKSLIESVLTPLAQILAKIIPIVSKLLESLAGPLKDILEAVMRLIEPLLDAIASALDQIIEPLLKPLVQIIEILVKILEPFFKLLEPILKVALAPIVNKLEILSPILDMIMTLLEPIMAILTPITDLMGMLFDIGGDLIKTVMQPVVNLLTRISDKLRAWVEKWLPRFTACIYEVKAAIVRIIDAIKDKLMGMVNWVIRQMNKLGFKLKEITEATPTGETGEMYGPFDIEKEKATTEVGAVTAGEGKAVKEKARELGARSVWLLATLGYHLKVADHGIGKLGESFSALETVVAEALQIMENRLRAWANITREIFGGPIRKAFKDAFGFLKLQLKETEGVFMGFLKNLWNSLMDFAAKVLANSLIQLAVKLVSMLVAPQSAVATMGIKDIIFKALGFDNPWNDAMMQRQGRDIVRHLVTGMQGALEPAFASGGGGARTIVVRLPDPIGAFAEVYEETDPDSQQRFGRATRKAVGRDKEAD